MKKKTKKILMIGIIILVIFLLFIFRNNLINLSLANNVSGICINDNDCNDNNQNTNDTCLNPGTQISFCNMTGVSDEES